MARFARKRSVSNIYHVMIRGVNKRQIFFDSADNRKFLKLLEDSKKKWDYKIFAYCLMYNHVHLLLLDSNRNISKIMQSIEVAYAGYFNKKYNNSGHVFQNRYNSKNVEGIIYFKKLVRYIHQNPEKAHICLTEEYNWSSYSRYLKFDDFINYKECFQMMEYDTFDLNGCIKKFIDFNRIKTYNYEEEYDFEFISSVTDEEAHDIVYQQMKLDYEKIKCMGKKDRNNLIKKLKSDGLIKNTQIADIFGMSDRSIRRIN